MNWLKQNWIKIWIVAIIAGVLLVGWLLLNSKNDTLSFKCPDEYTNLDEYVEIVAMWASDYLKENPGATNEDADARVVFLKEQGCENHFPGLDSKMVSELEEEANKQIDTEKLMAGIKYAESQRKDEDADSLIKSTNEKELYDNHYIKHLRTAFNGYLDGTNNGVEEGTSEKSELESGLRCGLDSFDKNYFKSEFNVIKTEKNDYGGIVAYIAFLNNHDRVFWTWVYQYAGGEFTLRGFCEYAALIEQ